MGRSWRRLMGTVLSGAVCSALAGGPAHAAEAFIDALTAATAQTQFVTNANVFVNSVTTVMRTDPMLDGVIGDTRQLNVTATQLDTGADFVVAGVSPMPQPLAVYNTSNFADGLYDLIYDANGAGLNANLSFAMGIRVEIVSADGAAVAMPGLDVTITLVDNAMNSSSQTQTVLLPVTPMAPLNLDFPFSLFGGVDPMALFSIQVTVDPAFAGDVEIGPIETFGTPEIETICDDGIDNNNNGFTDCDDTGCIDFPECAYQAPAMSTGGMGFALAGMALIGLIAIGRLRRARASIG